jgi:hypothetical protein
VKTTGLQGSTKPSPRLTIRRSPDATTLSTLLGNPPHASQGPGIKFSQNLLHTDTVIVIATAAAAAGNESGTATQSANPTKSAFDNTAHAMASTGLTSPRDSVNSVSSVRSGSRHQLKRSITELASPVKLNRRKEKERDRYNEERASHAHHISVSHPLSPNSLYQGRASVDIMTRSEGVTPYMSPDQSRRPSLMLSREEETKAAITTSPTEPKTNEKAQEDQDKTSSQVE